MKTLAVLSALFLSLSAQAATYPLQQEILRTVEINGEKQDLVGELSLDFAQRTIEVNIYKDICGTFSAEPGKFVCLAMPQLVKKLSVPMEVSSTSCGSKVYSGIDDQTPRDGLRTEITVQDHESRLCKDLKRSDIEVNATELASQSRTETTYYLAK